MEEKLSEAKTQMKMVVMMTAIAELLVEKGVFTEAELGTKNDEVLKELLTKSRSQLDNDQRIIWDVFVKKMFDGDGHDK